MTYKQIQAWHEARMTVVEIGIPLAMAIGAGIKSGFFAKVGNEAKRVINNAKNKRDSKKERKICYSYQKPDGTYRIVFNK